MVNPFALIDLYVDTRFEEDGDFFLLLIGTGAGIAMIFKGWVKLGIFVALVFGVSLLADFWNFLVALA